jgi:hypothetical protein
MHPIGRKSDGDADQDGAQPLAQDHRDNIAGAAVERIRHHSTDTDRCHLGYGQCNGYGSCHSNE